MLATDATLLIHLVGFMTGIVLYAMLGVMTLRASGEAWSISLRVDRVPLVTAILGLSWNCGALVIYGLRDLGVGAPPPLLTAFAFSSLGFLPAVVVHSAFPSEARARGGGRIVVAAAYLVSAVAGALQVRAAFRHDALPWPPAMVLLTVGYLLIIGLLVIYSSRQPAVRRALSGVALAAFAVMALHLGQHATSSDTWPIELVGHHASLPLALVILYQDYRFALVDIFLKRVLTLLALVLIAGLLYAFVAAPMVLPNLTSSGSAPWAVSAIVALWVITALAYPPLQRAIGRFVDRIVLRRADYEKVRADVATSIAGLSSASQVLDALCARIVPAMSARTVLWSQCDDAPEVSDKSARLVTTARTGQASVMIPTSDAPSYLLTVNELTGGRRLLSDDLALLETLG